MVRAPGVALGKPCTADVVDVAPTVLGMLGLPPGREMAGRVLEAWFTGMETDSMRAAKHPRRDGQRCRIAD